MVDFVINVITNPQGATRGLQAVDRSLTSVERSLNRIQSLIGAVFAFQAIAGGVRAITELADTLTNAQNRLQSLGVAAERTGLITSGLFDIANETRQGFGGVAEVFARVQQTLGSLSAEEQEVIGFTRTLTQAVAISGATTLEAEGALRQFTQGLAANRLSGQELNSVLEQLPILAQIIAKELGVTVGELRGLAEQGLITSNVLRSAVAGAADEIARRFDRTIPTIAQSFVVLNNRIIEVGGGFLKTSGIAQTFSNVILSVARNIEVALRGVTALVTALAVGLAARAIPAVISGFRTLTVLLLRNPFTALIAGVSAAVGALAGFGDQIRFTNDGLVSLGDIASVVLGRLSGIFQSALNAIIDLINEFIPGLGTIDSSLEDLARGAAVFLDSLVAAFEASFAAINAVFDNFGPVVQDTFITALNGLIGVIEDGVNSIIAGIQALPSTLFDIARDAILGFADIFDIGFADIVEFVRGIPEKIGNALTGLFTAGEEAGSSLVEGISSAIDANVDLQTGQITVALSRLENPASGALSDVGDAAGVAFTDSLERAPISAALESVIEEARAPGVAKAEEIGAVTADGIVNGFNTRLLASSLRAQAAFDTALGNLFDRVSQFTDLSEEELQNFVDNIGTILGGADVGGALQLLISSVGAALGSSGEELANAFSGVLAILDELGFELEDVIGRRGVQAVRLLGVVSSDEFQAIISLLGNIISTVGSAIAAWIGYGSTATAANTSIAVSGATATAATASTGVAATGASAAFGTLGTVLTGVGTVIATIFNAILTGITSIASTIASVLNIIGAAIAQFLAVVGGGIGTFIVNVLSGLASGFIILAEAALASVVGLAIAAVFLAIVAAAAIVLAIAIDIITDAVIRFTEFLFESAEELETFVNNIGDAIDQLIRRIVGSIRVFIDEVIGLFGDFFDIPARIVGELVDAILDLFRELARGIEEIVQLAIDTVVNIFTSLIEGVLQIVGALVDGIIDLFRQLGEGIAEIVQIAIDIVVSIFEGLGSAISAIVDVIIDVILGIGEAIVAVFTTLASVIGAVVDVVLTLFRGLADAIVAVFEAVGAAGQALGRALTAVFQALGAAVTAIFRALGAAISSIFNAVGAAARALGQAMEAVFRALGAAVTAIFRALGSAISAIFSAIGSAARALGQAMEAIFRALGAAVEAIFRSISAAANITFSGILRAASEIISSIIGFFTDLLVSVLRVFGEILATGARVLSEVIRLLRQLIGLLREAIELAKELGDELGGLSFPGGGGGGFDLPGVPFFAEGGIIEGPVALAGGGTEGKAFQGGGILNSLTSIFGTSGRVAPTSSIGVAGEAGPEAIMPLTRTSNGLGVTSVLPPEVLQLLRVSAANLNRQQASQTTIVQRIVLISTSSETVEDLQEQVLDLGASLEQRVDVRLDDLIGRAVG